MLFLIKTEIEHIPPVSKEEAMQMMKEQWKYILSLKREGKLLHAYKMSGRKGGVGIANVSSEKELEEIIANMPLFPFLKVETAALIDMEDFVLEKKVLPESLTSRA